MHREPTLPADLNANCLLKMFRKFLNVRIWCIYFVPDRRWTNQDALEHQNLPLNSHWASSLQYCSFSCYRRTDICHISLLVIQPNYDTATKKVRINPVTRYYLILILKVPYLRNCHLLNSNSKLLWCFSVMTYPKVNVVLHLALTQALSTDPRHALKKMSSQTYI